MVPDGWWDTTLEQVAEVAIGKTPARNEKSLWDPEKTTQNRWATIADIQSRYISETSEHISDLGVQHSNARLVPAGTLLMSFKLTLGRAAITARPMYTNEAIAAFYPDGRATTEYLYYLLPTLALEESSDHAVKGRTLNKAKLRALRLILPSLPEQRKIAAILSSVDDAIEKTQAIIDQVQVVKRGLMQELFTRGLRKGSGSRSEWPEERLGNLFTFQLGKMLNRKARETLPKFPYLGNRDVQWGYFDFTGLREMHFSEIEREKYRLVPGDLLVCEGGEIGRTALWTGEFDCYYQKAIHRLRVRDSDTVDPCFILHFMRFAATNGLFDDLSSQSSIAHLTREKLTLLQVPLPPLSEQREIAAILSAVDDLAKQTEATIRQAQVTKQSLMSVLLTGEFRVTPDIEPA